MTPPAKASGTAVCRENDALEVIDLRKRYGVGPYALDGVSVSFGLGLTGLLGPNGAGKSTLMRCIAGVENWATGTIEIRPTGEGHRERPSVGYLPESPAFPRELRVRSFLRLACSAKGLGKDWRRETDEKLEAVGLTQVADRVIGSLSKGYRQRLGLAQAMIGEPSILILDEPAASLDPINIVDVRRVIRDCARAACVIVSTHQLAEATSLCDRVVLLDRGRIAYDGPLSELGRGNLRAFDVELVALDDGAPATQVTTVTVADDRELAERVADFASRGYGVIGVRPVRDALERAFVDALASSAARQER